MDDTMKEEKVGKKPKGAVLVISIGKPSDKKPERAADPDKQEKMNRLGSEMTRGTGRPLSNQHARMGAGRQVKNQVRYQQGNLEDPDYVPDEDEEVGPPSMSSEREASGGISKPATAEEVHRFMHGRPPMEVLAEKEAAKKPKTEEEDLYANIFDSMKRASFDVSKATPAELMEEAERMRGAGEKGSARRFSDVASQMERGPALAESTINRLGMQAAQALDPDEEDQEAFARFLYGEGKRGADYQDMKLNPNFYPPEQRRQVMKLISQMARQKARAEAMDAEGQAQLDALREEDPTQFFADQDTMQRAFDTLEALDALQKGEPVDFCSCCSPAEIAWAVVKAKKKSKPFHGYNPNRHHKKGGLNAKGRAKFKRETGANLKPPVTTKPSKLKPGSKKAKRRKSFCARMGGMKGPTSKKGKLTPKGAALKRWNC
jgi:hypothetical protein